MNKDYFANFRRPPLRNSGEGGEGGETAPKSGKPLETRPLSPAALLTTASPLLTASDEVTAEHQKPKEAKGILGFSPLSPLLTTEKRGVRADAGSRAMKTDYFAEFRRSAEKSGDAVAARVSATENAEKIRSITPDLRHPVVEPARHLPARLIIPLRPGA
jgi:hypothetical protein